MIIFQGRGLTLELPNPDYPNTLNVNVKTKFKHAMDGGIYSTKFTIPIRKFLLPLKSIFRAKVNEVLAFLIATKGYQVQYIDEYNIPRVGKIITNPSTFENTNQRNASGTSFSYDIELEFEEGN